MRRRTRCRIDWSAVAALAAVAGVLLAAWQLREAARSTQFTAALESIYRLNKEWDDLADNRAAAATALLAGIPITRNNHIENALDFFDFLGLMVKRGYLDDEMAWHEFYYSAHPYWVATREYVRQQRTAANEPALWEDFDDLVPRLVDVEARHRGHPVTQLSRADADAFLKSEIEPAPMPTSLPSPAQP
ncbi:MAG: hypothetical protein HYR72_27070 [Deltaproteobacteria bacterium]|nr:hypothetical protein [Deltaproteobacteria bacterium]MBI3390323.1 hypothetical protein [Deltaproteobacteria bacterium]